MPIIDALANPLKKALESTNYCIEDMLDHGMNNWHILVLLDNAEHIPSFDLETLNDEDFSGHTPLDIAYRLNRTKLIEELEALGANGNKSILKERGVGKFIENNKYVHLPGKLGKLKTLEKRYMEGGCLNSRDEYGNTPIHWVAVNGHFKAAKYFSEKHFMFSVDIDAKNNEENTPRNLALLAGHQDIADQLLIWEIDDYITSARIRHKISAGLTDMLPRRKASKA
jgi:ankyrin repeat protein